MNKTEERAMMRFAEWCSWNYNRVTGHQDVWIPKTGMIKEERLTSQLLDEFKTGNTYKEAIAGATEAQDDWKRVEDEYSIAAKDALNEVRRAKTLFPEYFVNQHEGYAVILEELDELWEEVKKNQKKYDLDAQRKEVIQCAAMCIRFAAELLPSPPSNDKKESA